jgi:hypothetical protein
LRSVTNRVFFSSTGAPPSRWCLRRSWWQGGSARHQELDPW